MTAPTPLDYAAWRTHPLGAVTEAEELRAVLDLAGPVAGLRVLDVGCGDGTYAVALARAGGACFGMDGALAAAAAAARQLAAAGSPARVAAGDAAALPFRDGAFDLALAVTVLCFAADPVPALREMARVLRPGGRLVLGELGAASAWAAWRRLRGLLGSPAWRGATFRTAAELRHLARAAGLVPLRVRGAAFHPPLALAARLLQPVDAHLGRLTTLGAAFVALEARRP